ncbi:MAG: hypothetical protein OCD02_06660 [Spirochaetaceae bacterium]
MRNFYLLFLLIITSFGIFAEYNGRIRFVVSEKEDVTGNGELDNLIDSYVEIRVGAESLLIARMLLKGLIIECYGRFDPVFDLHGYERFHFFKYGNKRILVNDKSVPFTIEGAFAKVDVAQKNQMLFYTPRPNSLSWDLKVDMIENDE